MYQLVYSRLIPQAGGTYDAGERMVFGMEPWDYSPSPELFSNEKQAVGDFLSYLREQEEIEAAADVTLAEGWLGWGTVVRAKTAEGDELYSLRVEEYKEQQTNGNDIDSGGSGAAGNL